MTIKAIKVITMYTFLELNKLLLFIIIILSTNAITGQTSIIKGNIKNVDGVPLEFVTIQLLFNSEYSQSTMSDSLGNYFIETKKKGECELLTNRIGYFSDKKKITLKNDTTINFILNYDTIMLEKITIIGQKNLIEVKSDRYVVNIDAIIDTKGKETTDILKQLPSVYMSNRSLSIFGKSSVIVLINDRIVRLEGQSLFNYLNSLPPEIIKSVEIISSPPAEYDAEGNVGLINIITKKNIHPGWKTYFKSGYMKNSYSSGMISMFTNYNGGNFFFEGNMINANFAYLNQSNYNSYFPDITTTSYNPKKWNSIGSDLVLNLGYNINENSNIVANIQLPLYNKEIISDITNEMSFINPLNNQIDSIIYSHGQTIKNSYTFNSEVFYKHMFLKKKAYFSTSIAYLNNYTSNNRSFSSLTKIGNIQLNTEDFYTNGGQYYNIVTPKIDFSFPLLKCAVSTGAKLSFVNNSSFSNFYFVSNNDNILDPSLSNKFNYSEKIIALHYSMEKNLLNWSFKVGIRTESTQTLGNSVITGFSNENRYINFFPSLFISHRLNKTNRIAISFVDRIKRPPFHYLDPFRWYISKYDYAVGNPYLVPSKIREIELSYIRNNSFSAKLYFSKQADEIGRYVVLDSLNSKNQVQQTDNFLNIDYYGINLYRFLKVDKVLETVLQSNFLFSEFISNKPEFLNLYGISGTLIINNTFFLNKNFNMVVNIKERIPGIYHYRTMKNFFKADIGLNYVNNNKKFQIRLLFSDIFKTANPEYFYISGGVKQTYLNYRDTRMLKIVVTWRGGNWYNKSSSILSPSNIEEKQRI